MKYKLNTITFYLTLSITATTPLLAESQNFCEDRITDREPRIVKKIQKPDYLKTYQDPAFGTTIKRISDAQPGGVIKTMYNTIQAWNADETKLILYHTGAEGPGHHLYDGKTYQHIRKLDFVPSDIEDIFWDPKSPAHLYYLQNYPFSEEFFNKLVKYNVLTDEKSIVADIGEICNHPADVTTTGAAGSDVQAMFKDHIGVRCNNAAINGNTTDQTFYIDVRTGKASSKITIDPSVKIGSNDFGFAYNVALAPTPSNQFVVLQDSVFDKDMNFLRHLDTSLSGMEADDGNIYTIPNPEHKSLGRLTGGGDAMFTAMYDFAENGCNGDANQGVGSMVSYDLETGNCRVIIGESTGWGYPMSGTHVSAISSASNPGWVAMSTIGYGKYQFFDNGQKAPTLFQEITLTYADENNPQTCRLAHTRTYAKDAENASGYNGLGYFGEPHPVVSPSGTRILFSSDWYDSGSVDTYVIDLGEPGTQPPVDPDDPVVPSISSSKTSYLVNEDIQIAYQNVPVNADNRIAILSDSSEILSQPVPDNETGTILFASPELEPGNYIAQLLVDNIAVGNSLNFTVVSNSTEPGNLSTDRNDYQEGEEVTVIFTDLSGNGGDWISISPVGSPSEELRMWLYTNGTQTLSNSGPVSGQVTFDSTYIGVGEFEARLFIGDSMIINATSRFTVVNSVVIDDPKPAVGDLRLEATQANYSTSDDEVTIKFADAPGGGADWVSIAKAGSPDGELRMWLYSNGTQTATEQGPHAGELSFLIEYIGVGQFEARYFLNNSNEILKRAQFTISE